MQRVIRGSKDAALGLALRTYVNTRLGAIGEITQLSLDTADRRARIRVALRGEPTPVDVHVQAYALEQAGGQDWLTLVDVDASREWLRASLEQFAVGRRIPLSPSAARALRLLT